MAVKKCENGHYYDDSKYSSCPNCKSDINYGETNRTVAMYAGDGQRREYENALTEEVSQDVALQRKMNQLTEPLSKETESKSELLKKIEAVQVEEQNLTVGYYEDKMSINPVVGWLVCLSGKNKGRSYEIRSGRNFAGRSSEMDIILEGDQSVSRVKHAIFVYDAKSGKYIAQPGESRELFYVNDEVVLNNVSLQSFDKILIGKTELMFIALCGEKFNWEE